MDHGSWTMVHGPWSKCILKTDFWDTLGFHEKTHNHRIHLGIGNGALCLLEALNNATQDRDLRVESSGHLTAAVS